jgi:hypothetical protein
MVLEDPVGNRFCIVRSDAERANQTSDQTVPRTTASTRSGSSWEMLTRPSCA